MKVFKFGGASVKDAAGVKNILRVYAIRVLRYPDRGIGHGQNHQCLGANGPFLF